MPSLRNWPWSVALGWLRPIRSSPGLDRRSRSIPCRDSRSKVRPQAPGSSSNTHGTSSRTRLLPQVCRVVRCYSGLAVAENTLIAKPQFLHKAPAIKPTRAHDQRLTTNDDSQAPTVSCPPSGRKYCVPLIGSLTFRSSSCKSSLRSTKSMSDVFTISRSEDV